MENYVLFHGSNENFDKFSLDCIDFHKIKNNGDTFGHYFLAYDKIKIRSIKNYSKILVKLFKPMLYNYIKKQNTYTSGYIYQLELRVKSSELLYSDKKTLTIMEIGPIVNILSGNKNEYDILMFLNRFGSDEKIFNNLCENYGYEETVKAFIMVNKCAIVNILNYGTIIVFDDTKLTISNKKYIDTKNELNNKLIK